MVLTDHNMRHTVNEAANASLTPTTQDLHTEQKDILLDIDNTNWKQLRNKTRI